MKKVLQELFWPHFFWAPIPFKRYQNTSRYGTDWYKKGYAWSTYSCLHFTQFPLLDLSSRKAFFLIRATIHFAGTAIVKKNIVLAQKFLASMLHRISVLLIMLSQYLATVAMRGFI